MTEARLVTKEQLVAALRVTFADKPPGWADRPRGDIPGTIERAERAWTNYADAIFAALPAAAPAEGLREALNGFRWLGNNLHNSGTEQFREMYRAALEDARKAIGDDWQPLALARHESAGEDRHDDGL